MGAIEVEIYYLLLLFTDSNWERILWFIFICRAVMFLAIFGLCADFIGGCKVLQIANFTSCNRHLSDSYFSRYTILILNSTAENFN